MDTNGDGVITESEVPERRRPMLQMMASRMGLDVSKGISITTIRDTMLGGGGRDRREAEQPSGNNSYSNGKQDDKGNKTSTDKSKEKTSPQKDPLVPGFGSEEKLPAMPDFGERVDPIKRVVLGAGLAGVTKNVDPRMREHVRSMLSRFDRNHNHILERNEWTGMPGNPSDADRNHDGKITVDELSYRPSRGDRWRRDDDGGGGGGANGEDGGGESSANEKRRASYRFLMASERLPAGLPNWFIDRDTDLDGQVSMHEFAQDWTESVVHEYLRYDTDNDGMITPKECLAAAGGGEGEKASSDKPSQPNGEKPAGDSATPWWMQP
ncbi:MAG: hypothetical protein JXM70_06210 [Pirellulales bacterium]|nr:hypothetical protein [Pirellulales bacterium]